MIRVGMMTFLHNDNYGSILQAWALQQTLCGMGFQAEHIDYAPSGREKLRNLLMSGNSPRLIIEGIRKRSATGHMNGGFAEFRAEQLNCSAPCRDQAALRRQAKAYDLLLAGSDQIWSPVWLNPVYFLNFSKGTKIAYAPSLGVKEAPSGRKQRRMAALVKDFRAVSVREAEGAAILRQISGMDAPVLPDPVILVPQDRWRQLAQGETPNKPYLLCYFIGDAEEYWRRTAEIAADKGLDVRVIPRTDTARQSGFALETDVSPQRWLSLIDGAAHVLTDSFHGASFSAILNRPCTILRRYREDDPESKNSRVDQLLRNLSVSGLEDPDWEQVNDRLSGLAAQGREWLLDAVSQAGKQVRPEGER